MGTAVFLAASVMAFGAGCLARSRYERDCLVTEKYRIASEKIHGQGQHFRLYIHRVITHIGQQSCAKIEHRAIVKHFPAAQHSDIVQVTVLVTKQHIRFKQRSQISTEPVKSGQAFGLFDQPPDFCLHIGKSFYLRLPVRAYAFAQ